MSTEKLRWVQRGVCPGPQTLSLVRRLEWDKPSQTSLDTLPEARAENSCQDFTGAGGGVRIQGALELYPGSSRWGGWRGGTGETRQ